MFIGILQLSALICGVLIVGVFHNLSGPEILGWGLLGYAIMPVVHR